MVKRSRDAQLHPLIVNEGGIDAPGPAQ